MAYTPPYGPETPLLRRGCVVEEELRNNSYNGWEGAFHGNFTRDRPHELLAAVRELGEDIWCVLKQFDLNGAMPISCNDFGQVRAEAISRLIALGVLISEDTPEGRILRPFAPKPRIGTTFECLVEDAVERLRIEARRSVKVRYPYPEHRYDSDGQRYDVLGALDRSRLLWIECKKPLYGGGDRDPLQTVLSRDAVAAFHRRAWWLKPEIAIYLVDTKSDYFDRLSSLLTQPYFTSGHVQRLDSFADQVVARMDGFIYFCRMKYQGNRDWCSALDSALRQVLHDARLMHPVQRFPGPVVQ